jgi:hypothetical protein
MSYQITVTCPDCKASVLLDPRHVEASLEGAGPAGECPGCRRSVDVFTLWNEPAKP